MHFSKFIAYIYTEASMNVGYAHTIQVLWQLLNYSWLKSWGRKVHFPSKQPPAEISGHRSAFLTSPKVHLVVTGPVIMQMEDTHENIKRWMCGYILHGMRTNRHHWLQYTPYNNITNIVTTNQKAKTHCEMWYI